MKGEAGGRMRVEPPGLHQGSDEFTGRATPVKGCCDALVGVPADVALWCILRGKMEKKFEYPDGMRPPNSKPLGEVISLGMCRSTAFH
jgi:hypothetical protein